MDMIGQTIAHYKVLGKLGEGGMGVVYKAQDLKLDRLVALKFLPAHAGIREESKARFLQEAKSAASLNHPNICTIHGIEEHDGQQFIIMEFVEGHTLQEKNQDWSVKQAVDVGIQIADGLAAAHDKGIIHRDIKPDNIMIRRDGIAQIMDFGLAKLRGVTRLTKDPGTAGTAGYMSPEQAQGLEVDHRSDIFSLGVVLYELFTGQPPFTGSHDAALAYQIVNVDPPPMTAVRPEIDPGIERIVFECLQKDPDERYQSARDVSKELKRFKRSSSQQKAGRVLPSASPAATAGTSTGHGKSQVLPSGGRLPWIVAAVCFTGLLVFGVLYFASPVPGRSMIRASIPAPEKLNFFMYGNEAGPAALSPDGRRLAFVAADSNGRRFVYVRSLDETLPRQLEGTEGSLHPFWSPDCRSIGFFDERKLKRIDASGGAPVSVCDVSNARGGTWNSDGMIVLAPGVSEALAIVPASGGVPKTVTMLDIPRRENSHRWPSFLPDGKHFLYFARTTASEAQNEGDAIFLASIDQKTNKLLVHASSNGAYASGYLLYSRGTSLVAQRLDESSLDLKGEPVTIADGVTFDESTLHGLFTASSNGVLLYQTGTVQLGSRLFLCDRTGKRIGVVGDRAEYLLPRMSNDGKRIVSDVYDYQAHNTDLWVFDIDHGSRSRFTFSSSYEQYPIWSPSGDRILFNSNSSGVVDLYQKSSSGAGAEEPLLKTTENKIPVDWSPDSKLVLYQVYAGPKTKSDLWILPLGSAGPDAAARPYPFLQTEFNEYDARFSPDGRWVAYVSNESGRNEVYIRQLAGSAGAGRWQVSIAGGNGPRWRKDGKELFYLGLDNSIMAANMVLTASTAEASNVHRLFEVPLMVQIVYPSYDIAPDGNRFLVNVQSETQNQTPLTLVVNWDVALKK